MKPTYEKMSVLFSGAEISNDPSAFVEVPAVLPFTKMDTSERGSPVWLVTVPFTITFCANEVCKIKRNKKENEVFVTRCLKKSRTRRGTATAGKQYRRTATALRRGWAAYSIKMRYIAAFSRGPKMRSSLIRMTRKCICGWGWRLKTGSCCSRIIVFNRWTYRHGGILC